MGVEFQFLQARAAGSETLLRGAFDAPGRLQVQVNGNFMTTFNDVESVTHAGELVHNLARESFPDEIEWWGVEYIYTVPLPNSLVIREMRPSDEFFFIFGVDPLDPNDPATERFLYSLNDSELCRRAEWFLGGYQVGLSETALVQDRSQLHLHLLSMYGQ